MDMKDKTAYTVVAYNHAFMGRLLSLVIYKTTSKVVENNNFLVPIIDNKLPSFSLQFTESVEKGKTYYFSDYLGGERAMATNRATPIEALRDAFNCLMEKNSTEYEPHYLSMAMAKLTNTLRRMYQEEDMSTVSFVMKQGQKCLIAYQNTEGKRTMVHNDFR